jgi:predicted ATPase/class 3 adenylate cyclase
VHAAASVTTFLFTDIEGSTRLWEAQPARMRDALAHHDALARATIDGRRGSLVKTTGDGVHAAFADPLDALLAAVDLQRQLAESVAHELALPVRIGLHAGVVEARDADYFGSPVNRAARIMSVAHAGQILVSQVVADLVADRLPHEITLAPLGTVRLRGLSSPEPLHQVVHPQLRRHFPPPPELQATPHNLPQQLTSFIGRESDLALLGALVQRTRLVTIVGTGGLGKTRLALELANRVLDEFPDGVWFVELAGIADPRLVPVAVASVLSLAEEPGRSMQEVLVAYLRHRRVLLVLDNCEHLAGACASFVREAIGASSRLTVVATSREPLRIAGEAVHQLATLALPGASLSTPESLMQSDAVRLFVERSIAGNPAFAVTAANAAAIATICRRVDGIPLALELAAARMRSLSPATLATRLDDRFRVLTGGDRTALPRQQTLRALIDWSHDLLDDAERALFRRLGVFAGNFTLEACEAICAGEPLPAQDVLDVLGRLVDKSLVVLAADGSHYRMLETIRGYAADRLGSSGEARAIHDRHLRYFVEIAEAMWRKLSGPEQAHALDRLDFERENLLAAHAWCDHVPDGAECDERLVYALKSYWVTRGLLELGHRIACEALARTDRHRDTLLRCRALFNAGQIACWIGRYREARMNLEESLAIARKLGDVRRIAGALQPLGLACLGLGEVDAARAHLDEAIALARAQGDSRELLAALNAAAQLHRSQNELDEATPLYGQMLDLARGIGDRESIAIGLLNLAMATIAGNGGGVPAMLQEVLEIVDETGSKPALQSVLEVSAGFAAARREWRHAAEAFGAAEAHAERTGLRRDPADEAFLSPLIANARRALGDAAFRDIERAARARGQEDTLARARAWLDSISRG